MLMRGDEKAPSEKFGRLPDELGAGVYYFKIWLPIIQIQACPYCFNKANNRFNRFIVRRLPIRSRSFRLRIPPLDCPLYETIQ